MPEPVTKEMSQEELISLMKQWQRKLDMQDWHLSLEMGDFETANGYRKSGDFVADTTNKTATILMTRQPWRGDEEYTLVHEMLHVLVYSFDEYSESILLKHYPAQGAEHGEYFERLEDMVHHLTRIVLGRSDRKTN